jgi:hypothetical protein
MNVDDLAKALGAEPCGDGEKIWNTCENGGSMIEFAEKLGVKHERLVWTACQCARPVLYLAKSSVFENAVETAERWCKGEATTEEVGKAAMEALDAAVDADDDAAYNAYNAAYAAAYAAAYDGAAYIGAAAYAASSASEASSEAHAQCADIVRKEITWPTIEELIENKHKENS